MARPRLHTTDAILDAARSLVLEEGARGATVDGIVARSGAPKGSIYHRFGTLDDLLAAMWLRAVRRVQERALAALERDDAVEAAVGAALALHDFARSDPADARLLASVRREDLLRSVRDPELRRSLSEVNDPLARATRDIARRLYGRATRPAIERALTAIVDLPQGAIRRHLVDGTPLPAGLRAQLEAAVRAALRSPAGP
ncbi:MAG TPA: helix-turn-helix domain-containing protein [Solirubrobacteraceae bacterium]